MKNFNSSIPLFQNLHQFKNNTHDFYKKKRPFPDPILMNFIKKQIDSKEIIRYLLYKFSKAKAQMDISKAKMF